MEYKSRILIASLRCCLLWFQRKTTDVSSNCLKQTFSPQPLVGKKSYYLLRAPLSYSKKSLLVNFTSWYLVILPSSPHRLSSLILIEFDWNPINIICAPVLSLGKYIILQLKRKIDVIKHEFNHLISLKTKSQMFFLLFFFFFLPLLCIKCP